MGGFYTKYVRPNSWPWPSTPELGWWIGWREPDMPKLMALGSSGRAFRTERDAALAIMALVGAGITPEMLATKECDDEEFWDSLDPIIAGALPW
jgi:hypothetical protein